MFGARSDDPDPVESATARAAVAVTRNARLRIVDLLSKMSNSQRACSQIRGGRSVDWPTASSKSSMIARIGLNKQPPRPSAVGARVDAIDHIDIMTSAN